MATTQEFELIFGIESDGATHKTVIMRRVITQDLIDVNNDARVRDLRKQGYKISVATMRYAEDRALHGSDAGRVAAASGQSQEGYVDPVAMNAMEGVMAEMQTPLLARVILRIGDIENVDQKVIKGMSPVDIERCMDWYGWMNTSPKKRELNPEEQEAKDDDIKNVIQQDPPETSPS